MLVLVVVVASQVENQGGGGGPLAGRQKQSAPRRNLTHIKQGTEGVGTDTDCYRGIHGMQQTSAFPKMGFARQVYFNLLF